LRKHLLIPTDFSPSCEKAYVEAREMQRLFGSGITLLTVVTKDARIDEAYTLLEALKQQEFPQNQVSLAVVLSQGEIHTAIINFAVENQVDLIIVSTHSRSTLGWILLGSVTDGLLENGPCPLLIVPEKVELRAREHQGVHIVALTDFSEESERALPVARELYESYGSKNARLTLLHIEEDMTAATFGNPLGGSAEAIRLETEQAAEQAISEVARNFFPNELVMTSVVPATKPLADEINLYAYSHDVDYVVLASHGHSALESAMLGSVAKKLVHHSRRKLLLVPRTRRNTGHV